jgi:hypothetical protein
VDFSTRDLATLLQACAAHRTGSPPPAPSDGDLQPEERLPENHLVLELLMLRGIGSRLAAAAEKGSLTPRVAANALWADAKMHRGGSAGGAAGGMDPEDVEEAPPEGPEVPQAPRQPEAAAEVPCEVLEAAEALVLQQGSQLAATDVAQLTWALARLGRRDPAVFGALAEAALDKVAALKQEEVGMLCWALITVRLSSRGRPKCLEALWWEKSPFVASSRLAEAPNSLLSSLESKRC